MKTYQVNFPKEAATCQIAMTPLGHNRFRLEETPVLLEEELYLYDIIEARGCLGRGLKFQRLVERSGLRVSDLLLSLTMAGSEECQEILRRVEAEGGYWESVFGGCLLIHMPPESPYDPDTAIHLLADVELHPAKATTLATNSPVSMTFDLR